MARSLRETAFFFTRQVRNSNDGDMIDMLVRLYDLPASDRAARVHMRSTWWLNLLRKIFQKSGAVRWRLPFLVNL